MFHIIQTIGRNATVGHQLSARTLQLENRQHEGTGGVSQENRSAGFVPAFLDTFTGKTYQSSFPNGQPAPIHILEGLPAHLLTKTRDALKAKEGIVSGFLCCGEFFTRAEAAAALKGALLS